VLIHIGYELVYRCPRDVPMMLMLNVHPSRTGDLVRPDILVTNPSLAQRAYQDGFGNTCVRIVAPAGTTTLTADGLIRDDGFTDRVAPSARQYRVEELADDVLVLLLSSRYCDTELLLQTAWKLFAATPEGWARVQAICNFVNAHMKFDYMLADVTRTASRAYAERHGVCRDFAHLAVAFCRCMNIPARYCTGYLGDIGVPPVDAPMDFAAWFEAYLEGGWYTFDPRNNASMPRQGRTLIARGRDAADVAIATTFGEANLESFRVWTDETS
jgi:transglutaminase-like putative cysteine protease